MSLPEKYGPIVSRAARRAGAAGIPGSVFGPLDITAMGAIWTKMTVDIAKESGHPVNWFFASKFIYSIAAGSALYLGGSKIMTSLIHLIPGAGTVTAAGTNAALNYAYTRMLGGRLVAQFDRSDFDLKSVALAAAGIGSAIFSLSAADEFFHAHAALDTVGGADLIHGVAANVDVGTDLTGHAAPLVSVPGDPHFGYTAPGVHYKSTSDMIADRGWKGPAPADHLGYSRKI